MPVFYAVKQGFRPGVYRNWESCQDQVSGYPGAIYQKFDNKYEANSFMEDDVVESFSSFGLGPSSYSSSQSRGGGGSKRGKGTYYAVCCGYQPGIYTSWPECQMQVVGYPGAKYRKFTTLEEANDFVDGKEFSPRRAAPTSKSFPGGPTSALMQLSSNDAAPDAVKESVQGAEGGGGGPSAVVYTDGCCLSNGQENPRAGIGVYWGEGDRRNVGRPLRGYPTNIRAEIGAAECAMRQATAGGIRNLTVRTDSQFMIDSVTKWLPLWKAKGWKLTSSGKKVQNMHDFMDLEKAMSGLNITWEYVPAHAGVHGNEMADQLANDGAKM